MEQDTWTGWEVRRGDSRLSDLNRDEARRWLEDHMTRGVDGGTLTVYHRGRRVVMFSATFNGKRYVSLRNPNGYVEYEQP